MEQGCISVCILDVFFSGKLRILMVGRVTCSPLDTRVFWLDFAYRSANAGCVSLASARGGLGNVRVRRFLMEFIEEQGR